MNLASLANVKTLAVICTQWGDTGKGKLVDYFGQWAQVIARGTGGANAGLPNIPAGVTGEALTWNALARVDKVAHTARWR